MGEDFQKIIITLQEVWPLIRQAPIPFATLAVLIFSAGFYTGTIYYNGRISTLQLQITTKDSEIARLRVALGVDDSSNGALIALSNQELQAKASTTVTKLRDLCSLQQSKNNDIEKLAEQQKMTDEQKVKRLRESDAVLSDRFIRTLRSDAYNVDNELRRRLSPQAISAIVGAPVSVFGEDGTPVDILTLHTGGIGIDIHIACILANSIEQMAKILP